MAGFKKFLGGEFKRAAIIFDFDDTLFHDAGVRIVVHHADGNKTELKTHELPDYEHREGDKLDYSQFIEIHDPQPIEETNRLAHAAAKAGVDLAICTARGPESKASIISTLKKFGLPKMRVHCTGSSAGVAKAKVIQEYLDAGYDRVVFFDDNAKNVRVTQNVLGTKYGKRFKSYNVVDGRIR